MAQDSVHTFKIKVWDDETNSPLRGALVQLQHNGKKKMGITDVHGLCTLSGLPIGTYDLSVRFVGYKIIQKKVDIPASKIELVRLVYDSDLLEEVVVTAKSTKGLASGSVIGQEAMQHIQPSSFSDLLELLPGGLSSTPSLTLPNQIHLR